MRTAHCAKKGNLVKFIHALRCTPVSFSECQDGAQSNFALLADALLSRACAFSETCFRFAG
jgi:hypothetical protein